MAGRKDSDSFLKIHPKALESSLDYESFLKTKLEDRVGSRRSGGDNESGRSLHKQTASSAARMSQMRDRDRQGKDEAKMRDDSDAVDFVPMQHSWRRHLETSPSSSLNKQVPSSPAQLENLMKVAQDSMAESKRRSEMIDRLLANGGDGTLSDLDMNDINLERMSRSPIPSLSPGRRKKMGPKLNIEINSPSRSEGQDAFTFSMNGEPYSLDTRDSADSIGFNSGRGRARVFTLKRAFKRLSSYTGSSRRQRENTFHTLQSMKHRALKEKFLGAWKSHRREVAVQSLLKKRTLKGSFKSWADHSNHQSHATSKADEFYEVQSRKRSLQALRGLVQDRKDTIYRQQIEMLHTDNAANHRDKHLMSSAFNGIKLASRLSSGHKEIEKESLERRHRIANLMGALKLKQATPEREKDRRNRERDKERQPKVRPANSKGNSSTLLREEERESKRKAADNYNSGRSASIRGKDTNTNTLKKYGYNDEGKFDDSYPEFSRKAVSDAAAARRSESKSVDDDYSNEDEDEEEEDGEEARETVPPPYVPNPNPRPRQQQRQERPPRGGGGERETMRSVTRERVSKSSSSSSSSSSVSARHKKSTTISTTNTNSDAAAAGGAAAADAGTSGGVSLQELDSRAEQRKARIEELRRASQARVHLTQKQKDEEQARRKQREDELYSKEHEEYIKKHDSSKHSQREKMEKEALLRQKIGRAKEHRDRNLLIQRGFGPWRRLVQSRRIDWVKAVDFYEDTLLQSTWIALYGYCMNLRTERARREYRQGATAKAHYKRGLLQSQFKKWKMHRKMIRAKATAVTGHFSRFAVHRRAFGAWRIALERERRRTVQVLRHMKPRGDRAVKRFFWRRWVAFHHDMLLDKEVDSRAASQWMKVQSWLSPN